MSGVNTVSNKFNYDSNLFTPQQRYNNYFNKQYPWRNIYEAHANKYTNNINNLNIELKSTSVICIKVVVTRRITDILSYCKIYTNRGDIYVPVSPFFFGEVFECILFADASNTPTIDFSIEYFDASEKSIDIPDDVNVSFTAIVYPM